MSTLGEAKAAMRHAHRSHRRGTSPTERSRRDAAIHNNLAQWFADHRACSAHPEHEQHHEQHHEPQRTVIAFSPMPGEPGGANLPDLLLELGNRVFLPRIAPLPHLTTAQTQGPMDRMLEWVEYSGANAEPGTWGILEPTGKACALDQVAADLILVPGLAVSYSGVRLGQGGGFYDRALCNRSQLPTVPHVCAIIDDEEFVSSVPANAADLRVDSVLTPAGWHELPS